MKLSMKRMFCGCLAAVVALYTDVVSADPYTTMTDLGGGSVDVSGNWNTIFGNGGGICNGTLNATINDWWKMTRVTFTVGPGGKLVTNKGTSSNGQGNFDNGATLIIDGGEVVYNNYRSSGSNSYGFYMGNTANGSDGYAGKIEIKNNGKFTSGYQFVRVGYNSGFTGVLTVNNGTLTLPTNRELIFGSNGGCGIVGITNGTVTAKTIRFCEQAKSDFYVSMKDTTVTVQKLYKSYDVINSDSFFHLDNVTIKSAAKDQVILSKIGRAYTLEGGGMTLNAAHTGLSTENTELAGSGPFIKTGSKDLDFDVKYTSTGAIEIRQGKLAVNSSASFVAGTTIKMTDGATLELPFASGAFGKTQGKATLQLDSATAGSVTLAVSGAGDMTPDEFYEVCGLADESTLGRIDVPEGMATKFEDGSLWIKLVLVTHTWDGGATGDAWSSAENWNTDKTPITYDSVVFNLPAGGTTTYDLASVALRNVDIAAGAWTYDLGNAAINASSLAVADGASLTLANPKASNPLPTGAEAVVCAGLLDLGGAEQTLTGRAVGNGNGCIRSGFELRHGKVTMVIPSDSDNNQNEWCYLTNTRLTIGPEGYLLFPAQSDRRGEINFGGTQLIINGGTFENLNARNGAYIGNGNDALIEISNGGTFKHTGKQIYLGYSNDNKNGSKGTLSCTDGTVDLGRQSLYMGYVNNGASVCAMTNSTLTCGGVVFGGSASGAVGPQTFILKNTELRGFASFTASAMNADSSLTFDGATTVDNGSNANVFYGLMSGQYPYNIAEGGLTIKVSDNTSQAGMKITGEFSGPGDVTFEPQGESPRAVNHYGPKNNLTGTIVVKSGITYNLPADVDAGRNVYGGGFELQEGATAGIAPGATFAGAVTLNGDLTVAGIDMAKAQWAPVKVLTAQGAITMPGLGQPREGTSNRFYVKTTSAGNVLYYGMKLATAIVIH